MNETLKKYITERVLLYYVETYGCQMNEHESEKLSGVLEGLGFMPASEKKDADFIIFNTCCVREHAEERLYGNIGALKEHKQNVPGAVIAVCGCMMQQQDAAQKLMKRFPHVDMVFGTNHIHRLESLLESVLLEGARAHSVEPDEEIVEGLSAKRSGAPGAFVNIIYGCNNFCSYCVVPYVRGRERSRKSKDIFDEINGLFESGVTEITLLGQNVNSYGKDLGDDVSFPELLERIDKDTGIKRIRFMTSHPKDLTDELIGCFGRLDSLCEHIHLPVQSGSDDVLRRMNRRYTSGHYLELIDKLRQRVPDIAVTTDIIVGFPGETEEDFERTMELVRNVRYDAAYTFAYSSRKLTKAASMPGHLDKAVKAQRLSRLNALIAQCVRERNGSYLGREFEVLADSVSRRSDDELRGRTRSAKTVTFTGRPDEIGNYINVKIDNIKTHTLHGVRN